MRTRQSLTACGQILVFFYSLHFSSANAFAAAEKVVYSFLGTPDGANPNSGVVADAAGNLRYDGYRRSIPSRHVIRIEPTRGGRGLVDRDRALQFPRRRPALWRADL
jgi:hypothetical protein